MVILASYQDKLGDVVKLPVSCSGQGDGDFLASFRVDLSGLNRSISALRGGSCVRRPSIGGRRERRCGSLVSQCRLRLSVRVFC